ncbi:unnamed protein product [Vicia faba]|uniref:Leucine-rich repeat-containing N-terminal plant-type domain-containing protein n=1 Tax=Vicia faba TaxID=3906 RepID=A0AAV0YXJ5_VICFA|nr:unnamed protein product [Vicia faba]
MRIVFNGAAIALTFLSLLLLSPVTFSEKCNPQDKKVLLRIKQELNNPYLLASWDPKTDYCDWYCVECDIKFHRITALIMQSSVPDTNLSGHLLPIHRNSSISYHLTKSVQSSSPHHLTSIHSAVSNSNSLYNAPSYNGSAPSATSQPLADLAFSNTSATGQAPASIMAIDDLFGLDFSVGTPTTLPPSPLTLNPKVVLDPGTFHLVQIWFALKLNDGAVEYEDGTPATEAQMGKDVVSFLSWVVEPEMEERKLMGFKWIFVLSLALLQAAYYRRRRWSVLKSRKLVLDVVN